MMRIWAGAVSWIIGIFILGFIAEKSQFETILAGYGLAFGGFMIMSQEFSDRSRFVILIIIAFIGRILLITSTPQLSDDVYRFIWDARLQADGIPLLKGTPREMLSEGIVHGAFYEKLFPFLNSPDYFTVYPTVIQWLNRSAIWISGENHLAFMIILRLFHLMADITSFLAIGSIAKRMGLKSSPAFWYILNPLLIVECSGNMHYEGIAIALLLIAITYAGKGITASSAFFSSAILVKLNPALLMPLLIKYWKLQRGLYFLLITMAITFVGLFLGFGEDLLKLKNSILLYYKSFEFNAGVYYSIREIARWYIGYNAIAYIGPSLFVFSALSILLITLRSETSSIRGMITGAFISYSIYIFFSTTIHPWYILFPLVLGIFTIWRRIAIIWSFVVLFSYSHYWNGLNEPSWPWMIAEYMILIIAFLVTLRKVK